MKLFLNGLAAVILAALIVSRYMFDFYPVYFNYISGIALGILLTTPSVPERKQ